MHEIPLITVIIVNWNRRDLLIKAVASVLNDGYPNVQVVVIDNGSKDLSVEAVRERFPNVVVQANAENLGYSRGNNQGINLAIEMKADYLMFLNNDAALLPGTLKKLLDLFVQNPKCGASSPFIVYAGQPDTIWYGGGSVSLWNGQVRHTFIRRKLNEVAKGTTITGYITGCAMMVRSNAILESGKFDDSYVLYSEDVDLCLRLRKKGWKLLVTNEAIALHDVSSSTGGGMSPLKAFYRARSTALLLKRWAPRWMWAIVPFAGSIGLLIVLTGLIISGKIGIANSIVRGIFNGLTGRPIPDRFKLEFN